MAMIYGLLFLESQLHDFHAFSESLLTRHFNKISGCGDNWAKEF